MSVDGYVAGPDVSHETPLAGHFTFGVGPGRG
jgi:hypothetical protein